MKDNMDKGVISWEQGENIRFQGEHIIKDVEYYQIPSLSFCAS